MILYMILIFQHIENALSQCNVFDNIITPGTSIRVLKNTINRGNDYGIGIYTKFDPNIIRFSTELSLEEKMHIFLLANAYKSSYAILYSIRFDQKVQTMYHQVSLNFGDSLSQFSFPIDSNIATQKWIFMYIGYQSATNNLSIFLQLKEDQVYLQMALIQNKYLFFDLTNEYTIGGNMEINNPFDANVLYQMTQFRGSISDFYFKITEDCYFGTIPNFFSFISSLSCSLPQPCPTIQKIDLQKEVIEMKGYNFIIKSAQYKEEKYQISGWSKLDPLTSSEVYSPVLLRATVNYNYYDNAQVGDRMFYLRYKQSIQPEDNGFYFSTYGVNIDLTDNSYQSTAQDEWIEKDQFYEAALCEWHYFVFQYGLSDPENNVMLYIYFSKGDVEKRKYFKRKQLSGQSVYFVIGGDKFTQNELLKGSISNFEFQYCFKSDLDIQRPCHYSCQGCRGPTSDNCNNCANAASTNREYIPSTGECGCKKEFIDNGKGAECDDSRVLYNFITIAEIEETSLCQYGEFQLNDSTCIKCPEQSNQSNNFYCGDCWGNPRTWYKTLTCTFDFIQVTQAQYSNYIKKVRQDIDISYYIIEQDTNQLILCQGCWGMATQNTLTTQKITLQNNQNIECKTCYVNKSQRCVLAQHNCNKCISDQCLICNSGYLLINGKCIHCPQNCEECQLTNNQIKCSKCSESYGLVEGQCYSCGQYCKLCIYYINYLYQLEYLKCFKCIDNSKYFISIDGFNCLMNTIQNCEYALDVYIKDSKIFTGIDLLYSPKTSRENAQVYCGYCKKGYSVNADTKGCVEGQEYDQVVIFKTNKINFGKHITDSSKNQKCNLINCEMCLKNYLIKEDYCITCRYGYYSSLAIGTCAKCPKEKHCRSCQQQNIQYKDVWKWNIRPFYYIFINANLFHSFMLMAAYLDPRTSETICTSCESGYVLYMDTCIEDCSQDCQKCEIIDGVSQCVECKNTIQGQLQTHYNNKCLQCPYNCALCNEQIYEEYALINNKFNPTDNTKLFKSNQCLKSYSLADLYYNWNVNQFIECSTLKKPCYKQATIPLNTYCSDSAYQNALASSDSQEEFKKNNLKLSELFSLSQSPHLSYLETEQFYQIMNEKLIKTILIQLILVYTPNEVCQFSQEGFFNTTFQQNIFTLQNLELEIIGNIEYPLGNQTVQINSFIDINNFTKVTFSNLKFYSSKSYQILLSNPNNGLAIYLRNVEFLGSSLTDAFSVSLQITNPKIINLEKVILRSFQLINTHSFIDYQFEYTDQESIEFNFNNIQFEDFISTNSTLFYFNLMNYQVNHKITFTNLILINSQLTNSNIISTNQNDVTKMTGSIGIYLINIQNTNFQESTFSQLLSFKKIQLNEIIIMDSYFNSSNFIISNGYELRNLEFVSNQLRDSIALSSNQYAPSSSAFTLYDINFRNNKYNCYQAFIKISNIGGTIQLQKYTSYLNIFDGQMIQEKSNIMATYSLIYLWSQIINLENLVIVRAIGQPEFTLGNANTININEMFFDMPDTYHQKVLHQKLNCVQSNFNAITSTSLLFIRKSTSIKFNALIIKNQLTVNVPLVHISSVETQTKIQTEDILFNNSQFLNNLLILAQPSQQQSIILIKSEQYQNINFTNCLFDNNIQHSYEQSTYQSSSSIVIECPLASVILNQIIFNNNLITNSLFSNLFIRSNEISILNSQFYNSNVYNYENIKKHLSWGLDASQQIFYFENLQDILPIFSKGGCAYLVVEKLNLSNNSILESYAQIAGAFYISGVSEGEINLIKLNFTNCSSSLIQGQDSYGGALVIDGSQSSLNLEIKQCFFTNISSRGNGGSIYIQQSLSLNKINIETIEITNSYSVINGFLQLQQDDTTNHKYQTNLQNIILNNSEQGFLQYLSKLVMLTQQELDCFKDSYMFILHKGNINITNFHVKSNYFLGLFKIDQYLSLLIESLSVDQGSLYYQPLVKITQDIESASVFELKNSLFQNIIEISYVNVKNTQFNTLNTAEFSCLKNQLQPNSLDTFYQDKQIIIESLQNSLISQITDRTSIIQITKIKSIDSIQFDQLLILNCSCSLCSNGLVNVTDVANAQDSTALLKLNRIRFEINECGKSGCFVISSGSTYTQNDSSRLLQQKEQFEENYSLIARDFHFLQNTAEYGAGFCIIKLYVLIFNSVFYKNKARSGGGAIYFVSDNNQQKLNIFNTELINNEAQFGGAIYQTNFEFNRNNLELLIYQNNANDFGENFVSPPQKLTVKLYENTPFLNTSTILNNTNEIIDLVKIQPFSWNLKTHNYILLPSGQPVETYKYYSENEKKYFATNLTFRLIALNNQNQQMKNLYNTNCSISSRIINITTNESSNAFENNYVSYNQVVYNESSQDYNLDNLIIKFNPNLNVDSALQLKFECSSVKIPIFNENPPYLLDHYSTKYSLLMNIQTYQCQAGEYLRSEDGTCQICDYTQDQYTVIAGQKCKVKDSLKMTNVTSTRLQIRPEYWRPSETNEQIEYCKNMPMNCEGGWEPGNPSCYEGHIGALCEQCDMYNTRGDGAFSISTMYKCGSCESVGGNVSKIILITFWTLISIIISVNGTLDTNKIKALQEQFKKLGISSNSKAGQSSILIKVLTNYMQIAGTIATFQLQLPSAISSLFSSVGSPLEAMSYSLDCFLVRLAADSQIEILYFRLIWGLLMPIFYIFIVFGVYGIAILLKKFQPNISVITTTLIFMYLYMQPTLISGFVALASYRKISDIIWVQGNVSYKYYSEQHQEWLMLFILPFLVLIVLLIPLFLFLNLFRIRNNLSSLKNRQSWGYLYNEYQSQSYFWEIIKIFQKGMIIIFLTFYEDLVVIKAALIFIIVQIYRMTARIFSPFQTAILNQYDEQSSLVCGTSIVLGIAIYQAILYGNQEIVWPFYVILIILNLQFLLTLIIEIVFTQLERFSSNIDQLRDKVNERYPTLQGKNSFFHYILYNRGQAQKRVRERFRQIKNYLMPIAQKSLKYKQAQQPTLVEIEDIKSPFQDPLSLRASMIQNQTQHLMTKQNVHKEKRHMSMKISEKKEEKLKQPDEQLKLAQLVIFQSEPDQLENSVSGNYDLHKVDEVL